MGEDVHVGLEGASGEHPLIAAGQVATPEENVVPQGGVLEPRLLRDVRHGHLSGGKVPWSSWCLSVLVSVCLFY